MKAYIDKISKIEKMSSDYFQNSIEIEIDSIADMQFVPGYLKKVLNNKIVNIQEPFNVLLMANANHKENKVATVLQITVVTSTGKVFNGDETSQDRMVRAINIATITGLTETQWKLADNSIVTVTLDELKEALALAGQEMSRIWLV